MYIIRCVVDLDNPNFGFLFYSHTDRSGTVRYCMNEDDAMQFHSRLEAEKVAETLLARGSIKSYTIALVCKERR